jgi:hypothetical protein
MQTVDVLVMHTISDAELEYIAALEPRMHLIDGRGIFECEYAGLFAIIWAESSGRNMARATLGQSLAVSAFPRYVPV